MCDEAARIMKVVDLCRQYEKAMKRQVNKSDIAFLLERESKGYINDVKVDERGFYVEIKEQSKEKAVDQWRWELPK